MNLRYVLHKKVIFVCCLHIGPIGHKKQSCVADVPVKIVTISLWLDCYFYHSDSQLRSPQGSGLVRVLWL